MADNRSPGIAGEIVEPATLVTFEELCVSCNVSHDWLAGLVEQGVIDVVGGPRPPAPQREWRFASLSVVRVAKAKRLERDLGLNLPGIALALDLIDELEEMRARLRALQASRVPPAKR